MNANAPVAQYNLKGNTLGNETTKHKNQFHPSEPPVELTDSQLRQRRNETPQTTQEQHQSPPILIRQSPIKYRRQYLRNQLTRHSYSEDERQFSLYCLALASRVFEGVRYVAVLLVADNTFHYLTVRDVNEVDSEFHGDNPYVEKDVDVDSATASGVSVTPRGEEGACFGCW